MFIKDFFYMQKSDRRAILFILTLAVTVSVVFSVADMETSYPADQPTDTPARQSQSTTYTTNSNSTEAHSDTHKVETFAFDPNTADSTTLLRLGLQPWQVRNIYKYRAKGGIYRCKEDFAYVYGLTVKDYRRLAPYIRISSEYMPAYTLADVKSSRNARIAAREAAKSDAEPAGNEPTTQHASYSPKIHKGEYIEINKADTNDLKKIPGIGSYYARQTWRYRKQLGGFVSKKQLLEIEGFPEEAAEFVKIDRENITKTNINKLTLAQIKRHPYINYYQARAIVDYRRLHGNIKDIRELHLLKEFSEDDFRRLEPYIEY